MILNGPLDFTIKISGNLCTKISVITAISLYDSFPHNHKFLTKLMAPSHFQPRSPSIFGQNLGKKGKKLVGKWFIKCLEAIWGREKRGAFNL